MQIATRARPASLLALALVAGTLAAPGAPVTDPPPRALIATAFSDASAVTPRVALDASMVLLDASIVLRPPDVHDGAMVLTPPPTEDRIALVLTAFIKLVAALHA